MSHAPLHSLAWLAAAALTHGAHAQCTPTPTNFCVKDGTKTPGHPNPGGFPAAWYINGVEAPVLTLERGATYTFQMNNSSTFHPFFLTTSSLGGFAAPRWTDGVSPLTDVSGTQVLTFTVPDAAPDTLYYQCHAHDRMGWKLLIVNPPCIADYNGDTETDILDFLDFFDDFGQCDQLPAPCGSLGNPDVNGDTVIDILDFLDFLDAFGTGC
jgi:hypothetical protein